VASANASKQATRGDSCASKTFQLVGIKWYYQHLPHAPAGAVNSLGVVLGQEMERFNRLLHHITASLQDLTKALKVRGNNSIPYGQLPACNILT